MKIARLDINWRPDLPIFASESFLRSVGDAYGWLGGFNDTGTLQCILPYTVLSKAGFNMVRFRVETIPLAAALDTMAEQSFLDGVVSHFRATGMDMIIPATTNTIFRTYPHGAVVAPYGTYVVDLTQSEEALLSGLNTSHRRKVRLAAKDGVEVRNAIDRLDLVHAMVRDTFKRSKLGFMGFAAFERYIAGLEGRVKVSVAERQGVVQACVVVPYSDFAGYYVYGGSIPEPVAGATNLLHWETIRQLRAAGARKYDFVGVRIDPTKGSKQEGLAQYKERFGGQLVQGYMWKYSLRPVKFAAYSLAARFLKGGDIVDQERQRAAAV